MLSKKSLILFVLLTLAYTSAPRSTFAASTTISRFYAGCANFSVDVDVSGVTNDSNGIDQFRYVISDGNGKRLFQEDGTRAVGSLVGNVVINVSYTAPSKNPVTFAVLDLDVTGNEIGIIRQVSYDANCLPASGAATRDGFFGAPETFDVVTTAASPLYDAPNGKLLTTTTPTHQHWLGVYRTVDNQWVAVYANGNQVAWLPSGVLSSNFTLLPVRPNIIESGIASRTVTIRPLSDIHARKGPSAWAESIGRASANTIYVVIGRSTSGSWVQIQFEGGTAWISSDFACLMNGELFNLPVVG